MKAGVQGFRSGFMTEQIPVGPALFEKGIGGVGQFSEGEGNGGLWPGGADFGDGAGQFQGGGGILPALQDEGAEPQVPGFLAAVQDFRVKLSAHFSAL